MSFDYREYWLDKYMEEKAKLVEIDSKLAILEERRITVYKNCRRYHLKYKEAVTNKPIVDLDSLDSVNIFKELLKERRE